MLRAAQIDERGEREDMQQTPDNATNEREPNESPIRRVPCSGIACRQAEVCKDDRLAE